MSIPEGKGMMAWNVGDCGFGSDMVALAAAIASAGVSHFTPKILQETFDTWGFNPSNKVLLPELFPLLRAKGIQIGGYQYIEGGSTTKAAAEAAAAAAKVSELELDFFVIDAESEYKAPGAATWASVYMQALTPLPVPIGLCSYRYPNLHPELPWLAFLNGGVDFHNPQVYWAGALLPGSAGLQLIKSRDQLLALKNLPFVPVGSAYCEGGWCASPAQIVNFSETAIGLGLDGISFWDQRQAFHLHPELGAAIASLSGWPGPVPPSPPPPPDPALKQVKVIQAVNFRAYPVAGVECTKQRVLAVGEILTVVGERNAFCGWDWWQVEDAGGVRGWVAKPFVVVI